MILGVTGSNLGEADLDIEEVLAGELALLTPDVRADPAAVASTPGWANRPTAASRNCSTRMRSTP